MKRLLLTTIDNPYHPADAFDEWYKFDQEHGYHTSQRLAKVAKTSINLTDAENQRIINGAVKDFIRLDELNLYTMVVVEE